MSNGRITDKLFLFETKRKNKRNRRRTKNKKKAIDLEGTSRRMEKEHGKKSTRICGKTKRFCCLTRHRISKHQSKKLALAPSKCGSSFKYVELMCVVLMAENLILAFMIQGG